MPKFAFKFISGKYQGGEYPIPDEGELIIGRAADLDMVFVEDMVSRKHAKLASSGGTLIIADLGSTNGTFVNGEKVRRAELKKNDRVLIGTSILKVIEGTQMAAGARAASDKESLRTMMTDLASREASSTMSGDLLEVPLPDLLQLFSSNKKTGALKVGDEHKQGTIYLKNGDLLHVEIGTQNKLTPMKALCRMLGWTTGQFQFDTAANIAQAPSSFQTGTENLLMEAMRQNDEARRLLPALPGLAKRVTMPLPLVPKLSDLAGTDLDLFQQVVNAACLQDVLDAAPATDLEVLTDVHRLVKAGYLT